VLDRLAQSFGIRHAMVLVSDEAAGRLVTVASRGYDRIGVGSEISFGEGVIGIAAAERRPVRVSDMSREWRMTAAVQATAPSDEDRTRVIPLPGLPEPQSQLAVPMMIRGAVQGVLFTESDEPLAFASQDEHALLVIAGQLAALLALHDEDAPPRLQKSPSVTSTTDQETLFGVIYHAYDDSVFIDHEYVIKGVPGRLLWHFLKIYSDEGRQDFTNREIRLDPALRLPEVKDNLETRLLLLRRRLEEKPFPVRILRPARGRIRLEVDGKPNLLATPAKSGLPGEP
jgi:adenylate cyclase